MFRNKQSAEHVVHQRHVVFKEILYFNKEFEGELQMNALRSLHPLMKTPNFRDICFNDHKFTKSTFDGYEKEAISMFNLSLDGRDNWSEFSNACGSITAFVDAFPERQPNFKCLIIDLIRIVKDKTDVARKNGAVLMAKLAQNEENSKFMRENHGYEVLMSLRTAI